MPGLEGRRLADVKADIDAATDAATLDALEAEEASQPRTRDKVFMWIHMRRQELGLAP